MRDWKIKEKRSELKVFVLVRSAFLVDSPLVLTICVGSIVGLIFAAYDFLGF